MLAAPSARKVTWVEGSRNRRNIIDIVVREEFAPAGEMCDVEMRRMVCG